MNRFTPNISDGGSFNIVGGTATLAIQTSFTGISTEINSRTYYLGQSFNSGVAQPEVEKYTGNVIYVDNDILLQDHPVKKKISKLSCSSKELCQETNLNVSPYFDDFDAQKDYYKVLFKLLRYPVQVES